MSIESRSNSSGTPFAASSPSTPAAVTSARTARAFGRSPPRLLGGVRPGRARAGVPAGFDTQEVGVTVPVGREAAREVVGVDAGQRRLRLADLVQRPEAEVAQQPEVLGRARAGRAQA